MRIYLGTKSSLKKKAIENTVHIFQTKNLLQLYKLKCFDIDSKVSVTPVNNETFAGAKNRAKGLYKLHKSEADIFVGVESGLVKRASVFFEECWCVIIDKNGALYTGYSSGFALPKRVVEHLQSGGKHTDIMDQLEKEHAVSQKDTWALYSKRIVSRADSISEAFRNAFTTYITA